MSPFLGKICEIGVNPLKHKDYFCLLATTAIFPGISLIEQWLG
jgi:hypothetical protein